MTTTPETSNVYYLPTGPEVVPHVSPSPSARLRRRATRAWRRVRLTAAEIVSVLGRPSALALSDEVVAFLDRAAPRRPRFAAPARVIDLAAVRARRRAVPST